jgi:hypothetical protein
LSSYVTSHHLAVVPHSGAKDQFYCTAYYITLKSNHEAERVSKIFLKNVEDRVRSQNERMDDLSVFFYFIKRKLCLKVTK